jgi:hypothetical protein
MVLTRSSIPRAKALKRRIHASKSIGSGRRRLAADLRGMPDDCGAASLAAIFIAVRAS